VTDALLPVELAVTADGAVMVAVPTFVTFTVCDAVAVQPFASVTVTVYVVVDAGVTVIDEVVSPVDHAYDVPPPAVRVALVPAQIAVGPVIAAVGSGLTVTINGDDVALQLPFVTVTV
jgi:hypothetical protein